MNDTKIEWATKTWNPVTGCNRGCTYCYAKRIAARFGGYSSKERVIKPNTNPMQLHDLPHPLSIIRKNGKIVQSPFPFGFEPNFHRYRLDEPRQEKKPQNIFVSSMGDLFGPWIPDEWIQAVFNACKQAPQHRYLFLTKYPERYTKLARKGELPTNDNFWYGSSYINSCAPVFTSIEHNRFVSMEPILFKVQQRDPVLTNTDWLIIGAMTGPGKKRHRPERGWIEIVAKDAESLSIPVFMKDSLIQIMGEENMKRDFPWE